MSAATTMTQDLYTKAAEAGYVARHHDVTEGWGGACFQGNSASELLENADGDQIAADCAGANITADEWEDGRRAAIEHSMWLFGN